MAGLEVPPAQEPVAEAKKDAGAPKLALRDSQAAFRESLDNFCAQVAKAPDNSPIPVQLAGWPALEVPASAVLGVTLIGEGNTLDRGPQAAVLKKLHKYVLQATSLPDAQNASHHSWLLGFALIFLSEVHRLQPDAELRAHLAGLVRKLEAGRDGEKGWRHTLSRTGGYGAFVAVTVWAVAGLVSAHEQGVPVDAEGLEAALRGLRKSISGRSGGAFYYTDGRTDVSPGRAAGVLWVLRRYGGAGEKELNASAQFIQRHVNVAPEGHASYMMNLGWSALAAGITGGELQEVFWKAQWPTIFKARRSDTLFGPQKWQDLGFQDGNDAKPPSKRTDSVWPDPMYGDGWATAWMLFSWQCGLGRNILTAKPPAPKPPAGGAVKPLGPDLAALQAEVSKLLSEGKCQDARQKVDAQLRLYPGNARLLKLRALTWVPGLAAPVREKIDPKEYSDPVQGWTAANEAQALSDLQSAQRATQGKGLLPEDHDAQCQLLVARIHCKRFVAAATAQPKTLAWLPHYQAFTGMFAQLSKNLSIRQDLANLVNASQAHLPASVRRIEPKEKK